MAVKHFFGGETSKVGGIEKICLKIGQFLYFRVKFTILTTFFLKKLKIVSEIVILNADL